MVMFCLYLCNISLWYITNNYCYARILPPVRYLLFKLTLLSRHILLTLAPTPIFYFMSNFMENILHSPCSANYLRQMKWGRGSYFYGIVYWPVAHHSKCYKTIASLHGYMMVYDSYKHHSKYLFNNYWINVSQWGSYFYGIIYWPEAHNSKCYIHICQFIWLCDNEWFIQVSQ